MKKIYKCNENLILEYSSNDSLGWLVERINDGEGYLNGFIFNREDILEFDEEESLVKLLLAKKNGDYYQICIDEKNTYLLYEDIKLDVDVSKIMVSKYSNIFNIIPKFVVDKNVIKIGGPNCDIPTEDFNKLLASFPTYREKELYYCKKVQLILENYFENLTDYNSKYERYIKNKSFVNNTFKKDIGEIVAYDIERYELILDSLKKNLKKSEEFSEADWKQYIAEIILLLFPKYINYHKEAYVKLTKSKKKREFIDFILVKDNGAVDVLEVKKPDCNSIISNATDHGNYYSTKTLSIVVMQTEKYVYNLNRNIESTENSFDSKYSKEYPSDFKFRIMNPKGLIIIGQAEKYSKEQLEDLEIIRRMYSNIIEIITYDDMISMLERQIELLKKRCGY